MARRFILSFLLLLVGILGYGQTRPSSGAESGQVSVRGSAGFDNYGKWILGLGAEYAPIRYIGVSANFLLTDSVGGSVSGRKKSGKLSSSSQGGLNTNLYFMPELDFHAPLIRIGRSSINHRTDVGILITASPGIIIPASSPETVCVEYLSVTDVYPQGNNGGTYFTADSEKNYYNLQGSAKSDFFMGFSIDCMLEFIRIGLDMTFSRNDPYSTARGTVIEGVDISVPEKKQLYCTFAVKFTYSFALDRH